MADEIKNFSLEELVETLGEDCLQVSNFAKNCIFNGISLDSRKVLSGNLYVALSGEKTHGINFISKVLEANPAAILTDISGNKYLLEKKIPTKIPIIVAKNPRNHLGILAAKVYKTQDLMSKNSTLFYGVTGTNGKTTTNYFLNSALYALGKKTGLIGTIEVLIDNLRLDTKFTTPEAVDLHALFAEMHKKHVDNILMEVSSHALKYGRVGSVKFDVVGFTNLSQDHLDEHTSMLEYFETKLELFSVSYSRKAVVVVDSEWGIKLAEKITEIPVVTILTNLSSEKSNINNVDWQVTQKHATQHGNVFVLTHKSGKFLQINCGILGDFNIANAALAVVMLLESGVSFVEVEKMLLLEKSVFAITVPGRMQQISSSPRGIVDFAHNPEAMKKVLLTLRSAAGKLIVVFGATGERDKTKRKIMGEVAVAHADVVIITDDDPHDEPAENIRADILAGAEAFKEKFKKSTQIFEIFPRKTAIVKAVTIASSEDTILISGRGHEVYQEVSGVNLDLDDREELKKAILAAGFCNSLI